MKNLVIGLFFIGLTSLGFSQNKNGGSKVIQLEDLVIQTSNKDYLNKVADNSTADFVKLMELNAATYDITKCPEYDGRSDFFKVLLKGKKGEIIASYDKNGKIIKTSEYYKNFKIPQNITEAILAKYPKSAILKFVYTVNYEDQKDVLKSYKIQIMDYHLNKVLNLTSFENIDKSIAMRE